MKRKIIGHAEIRDKAIGYVTNWYKRRGWEITPTNGKKYDLKANRGNNHRYIEVKGSMNKPSTYRAVFSKNEKRYLQHCKKSKMHYYCHLVLGIGRSKKWLHKYFTKRKMPLFKLFKAYYVYFEIKKKG